MAKSGAERTELFTILGEFKEVTDPKTGYKESRFVPKSTKHFRTMSRGAPKNKLVAATFYDTVTSRSRNQVAYHFVLLKYIADFTGYTTDELHDAIMGEVFGRKNIEINGKTVSVRKSLSSTANLPKYQAVELIEYDLLLAKELKIKIPTPAELGYVSN